MSNPTNLKNKKLNNLKINMTKDKDKIGIKMNKNK